MSKIIIYLGNEYEVPEWANYIATDSDGEIWVFENKPKIHWLGDLWDSAGGRVEVLPSTGPNWHETLAEI